MADLGKYINLKDKTSAGRNIYNLKLPDQKLVSSTNLNKLRRSRAEFLKNNPEYRGKKTYIPEFQKPLAALKAELADKKNIKIEELVELVEKHFKGRYTPDPSPNLALSERPVYHYLKDLQREHPSVFKGTKVISEWSEGQDFKKWLLNKVKRAKNPIVTGVTELVEKSGFNVSPAAAAPLIRRNPILNKMITIKEPRIGKGKYDTYHSKSKKFRDWYTKTYDTPWEDLKETKGERASTYKYNAYTKYQADLKEKPPANFVRTEVVAKKINEGMPVVHQYGRAHDKSAPGQMFKKLFGATEKKRGKGYLKEPTPTAIEKWKEFQKGEMILDDLAKDVKTLHKKYGYVIKSEGFDLYKDAPIEKVMDKLGTTSPSRAASAMASLGRLYGGVKFRTLEFEDIGPSAKSGERLIKQLGSSTGGRSRYKTAFYNLALKELNKFYKGQGGGSFHTFRDNFLERLQKIIPDHTFNINEVIPITTGKVRNVAPWSAFVDVTQAKINQGALSRYGGELSTKIRQVEQALADPKLGTAKAEQLAKTLRTTTLGATKKTLAGPKYGLSPEQIKQVNFPEIIVGKEIDRNLYNQAQLDRWKKKGLDIEQFAKDRGYYFDVKKGTPFWEARQSLDSLEDIFSNNKGNACVIFPRKAAAPGGPITGGCVDQFRKALQDDPNGTLKMISEMPAKGGPWSRIKTSASNMINKLPKGGRLGMALTAIGAVGAGTYAMMGGAKAEEPPITDEMTYNATEGKFVKPDGDPETQEGVLNWIADNPIKSALAPVPVGMGAGLGLGAMGFKEAANFFGSMKFMLPPAYAAEKLYQYKEGQDLGEMFTNPLDAVWAMAIDSKATGMSPGGAKAAYYAKAGKEAGRDVTLGLKSLKPSEWKNLPRDIKTGMMGPRSAGTRLVFPFAGPKAGAGLGMKIFRGAARLAPLGPLPMALLAGSMAWDKYKFNKKIGDHVDALRSQGVVNEEDAQTMSTIYKQGWLGTTAIGAKLLGSEELMFEGEMLDIEAQKKILSGMKDFYGEREDVATKERVGERQEDFFSWFSKGGRVGLAEGGNKPPFGSVTRRGFLKWLVGSIAVGTAALTGRGLKQAAKTVTTTAGKKIPAHFVGVEGMPEWFFRSVEMFKLKGKLKEMADKDYVQGDMYEMMLPVKRTYSKGPRGEGTEVRTEMEKVIMEENPLTGEISMQWTGTDNFGADAVRSINFKPGRSGFQKFGVDDPEAATQGISEYRRVKVEEPEFNYTEPNQADPYREDIEYLDIFTEGDEVVEGLANFAGVKPAVTKETQALEKEAQKKLFKDIEGEEAIIPEPEGVGISDKGDIYGEEQFKEIIEGEVPDHLKKKAEGGIIETGNIARRPGAVPPLSGPDPQGSGIIGLFSRPKRVKVA